MPTNQDTTQLKIVARGSSEDYVWIEVAIVGTLLTVDETLAHLLVERFPTLPNHACKSSGSAGAHQTFGDNLLGALLPHAAEHVAIELLVAHYPGESFAGNSSWISREKQTMRVRVSLPQKRLGASALAHEGVEVDAYADEASGVGIVPPNQSDIRTRNTSQDKPHFSARTTAAQSTPTDLQLKSSPQESVAASTHALSEAIELLNQLIALSQRQKA